MSEPTEEQKQKAREIMQGVSLYPFGDMTYGQLEARIAAALAAEAAQPLDADIESYLREVEARVSAATPGPWTHFYPEHREAKSGVIRPPTLRDLVVGNVTIDGGSASGLRYQVEGHGKVNGQDRFAIATIAPPRSRNSGDWDRIGKEADELCFAHIKADGDLIAHARTDIPRLISIIRQQQALIAEYESKKRWVICGYCRQVIVEYVETELTESKRAELLEISLKHDSECESNPLRTEIESLRAQLAAPDRGQSAGRELLELLRRVESFVDMEGGEDESLLMEIRAIRSRIGSPPTEKD